MSLDQDSYEAGLRAAEQRRFDADIAAAKTTAAANEARIKRDVIATALTRELEALPLVPGGAQQLASLWGGGMIATIFGNQASVTTTANQPVGTFVREQLARPEYAHFLRPTAPQAPAAPAKPRTLSEAVVDHVRANQEATAERLRAIDGRIDPSVGFGLRPTKR